MGAQPEGGGEGAEQEARNLSGEKGRSCLGSQPKGNVPHSLPEPVFFTAFPLHHGGRGSFSPLPGGGRGGGRSSSSTKPTSLLQEEGGGTRLQQEGLLRGHPQQQSRCPPAVYAEWPWSSNSPGSQPDRPTARPSSGAERDGACGVRSAPRRPSL